MSDDGLAERDGVEVKSVVVNPTRALPASGEDTLVTPKL
jgi:hypothetical protein